MKTRIFRQSFLGVFFSFFSGASLLLAPTPLAAFPVVTINSVSYSLLEGPIHHGLEVDTNGIANPNLTAYEVQVKPDSGGPFPPYRIYNTKILPHDGRIINISYRNGISALKGDTKYCVRVRAIYGENVTSWAEQCGVVIPVVDGKSADEDGDGLTEKEEFAFGTDPRDKYTVKDGRTDGEKVADKIDPTLSLYPDLLVRSGITVDFGEGNAFGGRRNQHQLIELENVGDAPLLLKGVEISEPKPAEASSYFFLAPFPSVITQIPPFSRVFVPASFIPRRRGAASVVLRINSNNPYPLPEITLKGVGVQIPDCKVIPGALDFGEVNVGEQDVLVRDVTLANRLVPGDTQPENIDKMPWGFTLSTDDLEMAPGIRGLVLSKDEELVVPLLFQHATKGVHEGDLKISSFHCGIQKVHLKGVVK